MRKESGEITSGKEEVLNICTELYLSLYNQTVPTPKSTMVVGGEGGGGGGGRGQTVLTYQTNIFNNSLKTKQISDSWLEAKIVLLFFL